MSRRSRTRVRVEGIVQGVGFRPFVYGLATALGLAGLVGNDVDGVFAEVEGEPEAIETFLLALRTNAPPLASIERIATTPMPVEGGEAFSIVASPPGGARRTLISADTATCDDCLAELADPADRRFGYPFINCVNCGPRFTIIKDVPYDRPFTTMAPFEMWEQVPRSARLLRGLRTSPLVRVRRPDQLRAAAADRRRVTDQRSGRGDQGPRRLSPRRRRDQRAGSDRPAVAQAP
jgi:acylphosphatase